MKRIIIVIIFGYCFGMLLLFVRKLFQISNDAFLKYYLIFAGIVLVGVEIFNILYNRYYLKKIKTVTQLLKAGRVEEYIKELELMRCYVKGGLNKIITINLSDTYCKLEQYDKAIELLESLSNVKLYSVYKLVHRINLCICYFHQKQTDCAIKLYENSQRIFNPYRNSKLYGGNIVILDIFAAISIKDYVRASELLQTAQSTWNDPCFLNEYRYLEESIHQSQAE